MHEKLKDTIQDCNLNFLLGSGLSRPYLSTLGNIETLLTALEEEDGLDPTVRKLVRVSLYKKYFDEVIGRNVQILSPDAAAQGVLEQYLSLLRSLNAILLRRRVTLIGKEANLFTTNVDIFIEKALDDLHLEYNDGFSGRFKPAFSLSNFKKAHYKKSLHYDNTAEIPVFNLCKLHGSLSWKLAASEIVFSSDLAQVKAVASKTIPAGILIDVAPNATVGDLLTAAAGKAAPPSVDEFMEAYEQLLIVVNPTKEKFRHTLMNQTYYELLRLYSNELEKENTVLFVMGFSFADEHIREITLRAANSNPTLVIYVFAFDSKAETEIKGRFGADNIKNKNVIFLKPPQEDKGGGVMGDKFQYDFQKINEEVGVILRKVKGEGDR